MTKLLIVVLIAIAAACPALGAQTQQFEVASVKQYKPADRGDLREPAFLPGGRFRARAPLILIIAAAYDIPFNGPSAPISGGPDWIRSIDGVYDIEATAPRDGSTLDAARERQMLQKLLADRFQLVMRRETKNTPVYVLTVDKGGPKLQKADIQEKDCPETTGPTTAADADKVCHRFNGGRGRGAHARAATVGDLVKFVQGWTDRQLFDETGIQGLYRFDTEPWLPMELDPSKKSVDGADMSSLPTIFTVFQRLGLKMSAQQRKVDSFVIEHVEMPAEN